MSVPTGPKVITSRFELADGHTYAGYVRTGGYVSLRKAVSSMTPQQVHDEVKAAEIQGRGGAGFPAGTKWGFLPAGVHPRYLVINGDESEPGTYKDRLLMERDPHQLIEGIVIACYALNASQAFLYVRGEMAHAQERLAQALNDAYANNMVGKNICGSSFSVDVTLTWGAGAYIVGEETALIESLEGERGMPRLKPPFFPAVKGLYMQPTIVNNVETLANVPYIVGKGGSDFKSIGAPTSTGMRMFAVSGHVNKPGVFEVPNGVTTFRMLFEAPEYCGGIRNGGSIKAFIPGGASAMWFFPEHLDMALDKPTVDKAGSMLGSGAIVAMDQTTDMVAACWRIVRFFARESCGKCTPCREGTTWLERVLKRMLDGHGRAEDIDLLFEVSESISPGIAWPPRQTTICPLGPSAVSPIASAVRRFRHEFEHYIEHGRPIDGVESPFATHLVSHS
ncbi:MAG: NADH-quinone oxidoreductase subunit [Actinomycetota bacterium]|jgi:NADH-quinone oxidoreductase subunit F|nr:NADH-quinone oxidoreductase subunit NuoF [Ilumatobacteraceae bacterium]